MRVLPTLEMTGAIAVATIAENVFSMINLLSLHPYDLFGDLHTILPLMASPAPISYTVQLPL
jgi:hypothetical protein